MALLLDLPDIERLHAEGIVTMADHVSAIDAAYRSLGEGSAQIMPRFNMIVDPAAASPKSKSLKVGGGTLPAAGMMGSVLYSAGFTKGHIELWVMLYSTETGQLAGLVRGQAVSLWKTGATAAVAARYMAKPGAGVVGLIGTGNYARAQLLGLAEVRPLTEVRCFSRSVEKRNAFADWASARLPNVRIRAVGSAREAVEGVDILVTVTNSPEPVLSGEWISAGTHCNAVGAHYPNMREVDTLTVQRSRVIVDDLTQAMQEKGEIIMPLKEGAIMRDHIVGSLGDVAAGRLAGRTSHDQITLFCSGGVPIEYMGSCAMLLERASKAGIGQVLATV
jgi:ornithine cyclodeaminase/alanine dehydrogenase-like protein (mu-crystallin family)